MVLLVDAVLYAEVTAGGCVIDDRCVMMSDDGGVMNDCTTGRVMD